MKQLYYTLLALCLPLFTHAQLTEPDQNGGGQAPIFTSNTKAPGDSCGVYYNNYVAIQKTSSVFFEAMRTGNGSEFNTYNGRAQRYNAPQPIEISGLSFYSFESNPAVDSLMAICHLYDYEPVGDTVGALLAVDTVWVTHQAFSFVLPDVQVNATFDPPVTVTDEYMVAVFSPDDDSLKILTSDFGSGDGNGEGVSYLFYGNPFAPGFEGWYNSWTDFGMLPNYDGDYMINPRIKYDLHDDFVLSDDSICPGVVNGACVSYTQQPIYADPHYNGYSATPTNHILWLWGDGFQNTNLTMACHTYANPGDYDIELNDTLRRFDAFSPFCVAETINPLHVIDNPNAGFTFTQNGTIIDFTNTSTLYDSLWWDFGDTTAGVSTTNPTHDYGVLDTFTVTLVAYNECGATDTVVAQIITDDVGFNEEVLNFKMYPNPANNQVNITGLVEGATLELVNLLGQPVYRKQVSNNTEVISTENYPNGSYFIRLSTESGQLTKKLLIQH